MTDLCLRLEHTDLTPLLNNLKTYFPKIKVIFAIRQFQTMQCLHLSKKKKKKILKIIFFIYLIYGMILR